MKVKEISPSSVAPLLAAPNRHHDEALNLKVAAEATIRKSHLKNHSIY